MSSSNDITPLLGQGWDAPDVGFRQGTVTAWNAETGENTVNVGGTDLHDLPILVQTEKLSIQVGDAVGLISVKGQMYIQGRLRVDSGDIVVRSAEGATQVVIGRSLAGGGRITTRHPNGETGVHIGELEIEATGERVGHGFFAQQDDGVDVFGAGPITPGGRTLVRIRDTFGHLVYTTKSVGGWSIFGHNTALQAASDETYPELLSRPYMDVPMYPISSLGNSDVDSAAYTTTWQGRMHATHPALHIAVRVWCGASATGGAYRVLVGGEPLGSTGAFSGDTAQIIDLGPRLLPAAQRTPYSYWTVELQFRRTGGSGPVVGMPYSVVKRGTP